MSLSSQVSALASRLATEVNTLRTQMREPRIQTVATGSTITPAMATADVVKQINTEALGTLTIANPTGSPTGFRTLVIRVKSTNAHAITWGSQYRATLGVGTLPANLTGASYTDYFIARWNADDSKWDVGGWDQVL